MLGAVGLLAASGGPAQAAFPGENGALTWVGSSSDGGQPPFRHSRFTVAPRGGALRREPVHRLVGNLVASPDGRRVAYQYGTQIYVARRDGSRARRVAASGTDPAWAPDGERLVYAQVARLSPRPRVAPGLIVRRIDGGRKRRLTRESDGRPAWSPDGRTIVFVREGRPQRGCAGTNALYAIRARDGRTRRLLRPGFSCGWFGRPDWSPRSDRLVVTLDQFLEEGGDQPHDPSTDAIARARIGLNIVKTGGRRRGRLRHLSGTPTRLVPDAPVWSPGGRQIAFHARMASCAGEAAARDALCAIRVRDGALRTIVTMARGVEAGPGLTWFAKPRRR